MLNKVFYCGYSAPKLDLLQKIFSQCCPYALIMMISALVPITPNMKMSRTVTAMMLPMDLTDTIMHCTTCFSPATAHDRDQGGYRIGAVSDGRRSCTAPPASVMQQHMTMTKEDTE